MKKNHSGIKACIVILTLVFIWGNSLLSAELSSLESGFVLRVFGPHIEVLQRLLARFGILCDKTLLVRKLAHFSEFGVLGVVTMILFAPMKLRFRIPLAACLCLGAALFDEGLQHFSSGRAPALRDVAIDFSGAVCGIAAAAVIAALCALFRKPRQSRRS